MGYFKPAFGSVIPDTYRDTTSEQYQDPEVPAIPDKPISEQMRAQLLSAEDPLINKTQNAMYDLEDSLGRTVPVPNSLKPKSVKDLIKESLLGAIPFYGKAREASQKTQMLYDQMLYKQAIDAQTLDYNTRKDAAMKWHDAQVKMTEKQSEMLNKGKVLTMIYPNATQSMLAKAMGIEIPMAKQVKFEERQIVPSGPDGSAYDGGWITATYNPMQDTYTYKDPWTGKLNTAPSALAVQVRPIQGPSPLQQTIETLQGQGVKMTPELALQLTGHGPKEAKSGSDIPLDRRQAELEMKVLQGTATPEEKTELQAVKKARLTVPVYSAGAADSRADQSWVRRMAMGYDNSPTIKRFTKAAEGVDFALRMNPKSQNPFDHQGLIYSFAKVMDPESVVREGEYKTVQKYAQSWLEATGMDLQRVIDNKGLLTPKAIKQMQQTMKTKFATMRDQANAVKEETARIIDSEMPGMSGNMLRDYTTGYDKAFSGNPNLKVQRNRRTGAVRYSLDGGKTWQNGEPPTR